MQMHESKGNAGKSSSSSHKYHTIKSPNNQVTSNSNNNSSKKSKSKNSTRDKLGDDNAKSASVMSNLSSYSLIDDDHIDDQETINVGNLIIDLESDIEKEKIESEQAVSSGTGNSTKFTTSGIGTSNAASSTSSSFGIVSNVGKASSSTNISSDSTKPTAKSNQKFAAKNSSGSSNSSMPNVGTSVVSSNNGHGSSRTVFKTSSDERCELKMKITRETKPGRSEHKIVTSPNQKSPTSCSSSCNNNSNHEDITVNRLGICEDKYTQDSESKCSKSLSNISSTKECGTSTSVGTITEPDCLGPCEPGTSVTLEGIVWQETDGGILVVNVTWRGKTYVGALLDCTRHDWAPPRLCDSPASDIDLKNSKGVRTKRIVTRSNGTGLDEKNLLQTTGKLRNGKGRRIPSSNDPSSCSKKQRESSEKTPYENAATGQPESNTSFPDASSINSESTFAPMSLNTTTPPMDTQQDSTSVGNTLTEKGNPNSPLLIGCSEPNCSKKYRNMSGLLYHQAHAHSGDYETNNAPDETNCSSSTRERAQGAPMDALSTEQKGLTIDINNQPSPGILETKDNASKLLHGHKRERTPSPEVSNKMVNKTSREEIATVPPSTMPIIHNNPPLAQEPSRGPAPKVVGHEHRHPSNYGAPWGGDPGRRSPGSIQRLSNIDPDGRQGPPPVQMHNNHHPPSSKSSSSSSSKQPNQATLPVTTEEGMKPSGTSTGPPPAPHQSNCYFNNAFVASTLNHYQFPPFFPRHMYDQITPPAPNSNAAILTRFMNSMRVPQPPESPSRMLSPSVPKNIPFPPFKVDPNLGPPPIPTSQLGNPPPPPNISSITHPPLPGGSPNFRMPSPGDPMMPPTSQPPFLPPGPGFNPALGVHGLPNQLGPLGGPQMPSLVEDPLAKQFPRRFN